MFSLSLSHDHAFHELIGYLLQVVQEGDEAVYNKLLERYHATELQEEKERILSSLGYTKSPELAQRTLALAISSDVRSQATVECLAGVASNPIHSMAAWEFFKANFDLLFSRSVISTCQYRRVTLSEFLFYSCG